MSHCHSVSVFLCSSEPPCKNCTSSAPLTPQQQPATLQKACIYPHAVYSDACRLEPRFCPYVLGGKGSTANIDSLGPEVHAGDGSHLCSLCLQLSGSRHESMNLSSRRERTCCLPRCSCPPRGRSGRTWPRSGCSRSSAWPSAAERSAFQQKSELLLIRQGSKQLAQ